MTTSIDPNSGPAPNGPAALGRYTLRHCLGQGGMGTVHLAEDTRLRRLVAIKSIRDELCRNEEVRKRIERECLLHARIGSHPHIVTLYDRLDEGDHIYLVMEYVEGKTLDALMDDAQTDAHALTWKDGIDVTIQVLDALARIHSQNIVHRDIKPSNILVTKSDSGETVAKLMDFGIARLEDSEAFATAVTKEGSGGPGTPTYMAPEQIDRQTFGPVSPATDIYAVGVMLYQLLSGAPPFTGTITEVFHSHLNVEPVSLDRVCAHPVPAELTTVLRRALAKHPRDRFDSARAMREALEQASHAVSSDAVVYRRATAEKTQMESAKTVAVDPAFGPVAGYEKGATVLTGIGTRMTRRKSSTAVLVIATAGVAVLFIAIGAFLLLGRGKPSTDPSTASTATTPETPTAASAPGDAAVPAAPADPTTTASVPPQPQPVSPTEPQPIITAEPPSTDGTQASGGAMAAFLEKRGTDPEPVATPPAPAPAPDTSSQQNGSAAAALAASSTTPNTPAPSPPPAAATPEPPKPKPKPDTVKSEPITPDKVTPATPDNVTPVPEKKKEEPNILEGIQVKTHSEKISN
ncbi:MAG: serine/threonine protein kinase [Candidatus Hydrogenedentes bacterium]|nr:serine/threonine protein kinase [Candidatus Hydrogenedentota bacterium]